MILNKTSMSQSNLRNHKFIVLCEDHYNPLGIVRSLGEEGINSFVVLCGEDKNLVRSSKYIGGFYNAKDADEGLQYIIDNFGHEDLKPFLYTSDDKATQLIGDRYDELIDKFYFFNCGSAGATSHYMEKEVLCDIAQACGINKPKGEVLRKGEMPKTLRYPVITKVTKSTLGAWKDDVFVCANEDELREAYSHIKADELLVQEYLVKKNELCVDGISINGGEEVWMPYTSEYIRMKDMSYGQYMWIKPYTNQRVRKSIQDILKATHFSGIFSLECIIDKNDDLWFLEVNFRNSTWSYSYTYAGLNLPYQWAKATLEGHIDYDSATVRSTPFRAMNEFDDFRDSVLHSREVGLRRWFGQVRECEVLYYYNRRDKKPFYVHLFHDLSHAVMKRLKRH